MNNRKIIFQLISIFKDERRRIECVQYPDMEVSWEGSGSYIRVGSHWVDELSFGAVSTNMFIRNVRTNTLRPYPMFEVEKKHWDRFQRVILAYNQEFTNNTLDIMDVVLDGRKEKA
jgi:hypothetical protein